MTAAPSEQRGDRRRDAEIKPGWIVPSDDVDLTGLSARRWTPFTDEEQRILDRAKATPQQLTP